MKKRQKKAMTSKDPFPIGRMSEPLFLVPVIQPGALSMQLRNFCGTWTSGKFTIDVAAGLGGNIRVDVTKGCVTKNFEVEIETVIEACVANFDRAVDTEAAMREVLRERDQQGSG